MQTSLYSLCGLTLLYPLLSLVFTDLVQEHPRKPYRDAPAWGRVADAVIPTAKGGRLEVWRIEPDGPSRGVVLLVHGWGRKRGFNRLFGMLFERMIVFWMNLFYRNRLKDVNPARLAQSIRMPVMGIHGAQDRRFPVAFAPRLKACLPPDRSELFVAENARHSESRLDPRYAASVRGFIDRPLGHAGDRKSLV